MVQFSMLGHELTGNSHLRRAVRAGLAYASADPFSRRDSDLREFEEALGQFKGVMDSYIHRSRISPEWLAAMENAHRILSELSMRQTGRVQAEYLWTNLQQLAQTMAESMEGDQDEPGELQEMLSQMKDQAPPASNETVGGSVERTVNLVWNFLYAVAVIAPLESLLD